MSVINCEYQNPEKSEKRNYNESGYFKDILRKRG